MQEALRAAAANRPLNTGAFLGAIKRLTHSFATTKPKAFVLATSISLPQSVKISPIRLDGGLIILDFGSSPFRVGENSMKKGLSTREI